MTRNQAYGKPDRGCPSHPFRQKAKKARQMLLQSKSLKRKLSHTKVTASPSEAKTLNLSAYCCRQAFTPERPLSACRINFSAPDKLSMCRLYIQVDRAHRNR